MKEFKINSGWNILQDVKDCGEELAIYSNEWGPVSAAGQGFSEWEPIDRLTHLQLLFAKQPYFGRELRSFNNAPWWYKNEFVVPQELDAPYAVLRFEGVDYYCKVWLNGEYLGEHEGYFAPFEFQVGSLLKRGEPNNLVVKVWSPWDKTTAVYKMQGGDFRMTVHDMMKGTYEHSDGFIQRDVNPVGIWESVKLLSYSGVKIEGEPLVKTQLSLDASSADIQVDVPLSAQADDFEVTVCCEIFDEEIGLKQAGTQQVKTLASGTSKVGLSLSVENPKIWNTWDRGAPHLYRVQISIYYKGVCTQKYTCKFGIRTIEINRTAEETTFILNGKKIYLRGTSYFPDIYISKLNKDRYSRDLKAMIALGCNIVRVHVHVAKPSFYELCDELGILVMQDSDLNWLHPDTEEFKDRAVHIFEDMVKGLRNHPSIACWVCMNEPDIWALAIQMGMMETTESLPTSMMHVTPGPQLVEALKKLDPTRPYIKGSIQHFDLESGDMHNYFGSLIGEQTHYTDICDMPEKLNTEFGFDAPACAENLRSIPEVYSRLRRMIDKKDGIEELQYYQYRLLKFFIEHYRIMKYRPCSGYVQFLFSDICPQSFYGVYDWWGIPKKGVNAMEESNLPVGIFMEYKNNPVAIWIVNDLLEEFTDCTAEWIVTDQEGKKLFSGSQKVDIGEDSAIRLCDFTFPVAKDIHYDVRLFVKDACGHMLTKNVYHDAFQHPAHPKGHPADLSHELGMRVFGY